MLDQIFGEQNFRAEIVWKRSAAHSDTKQGSRQPGRIHDSILFYTKGSEWTVRVDEGWRTGLGTLDRRLVRTLTWPPQRRYQRR